MAFVFNALFSGLRRLKNVFFGATAGIAEGMGKGYIEKYLLEQIQGRFAKPGQHPNAQKGPDDKAWPLITSYTLRKRRRNRDAAQALVDTGTLRDSIIVTDRDTLISKLRGQFGGGFTIGVRRSSAARGYAGLQQFGGRTRYGYVPPRPFMGASEREREHIGEHVKLAIERGMRGK